MATKPHRPRVSPDQYFFSQENLSLLIAELGSAVAERQGKITPVAIQRDDELCRRITDICFRYPQYVSFTDPQQQRFNAVLLPDRTPSPFAGRALVVIDSAEPG